MKKYIISKQNNQRCGIDVLKFLLLKLFDKDFKLNNRNDGLNEDLYDEMEDKLKKSNKLEICYDDEKYDFIYGTGEINLKKTIYFIFR